MPTTYTTAHGNAVAYPGLCRGLRPRAVSGDEPPPALLSLFVGKGNARQGPFNLPHTNRRFVTRERSDREAPSRAQLLWKSTYQHQGQLGAGVCSPATLPAQPWPTGSLRSSAGLGGWCETHQGKPAGGFASLHGASRLGPFPLRAGPLAASPS